MDSTAAWSDSFGIPHAHGAGRRDGGIFHDAQHFEREVKHVVAFSSWTITQWWCWRILQNLSSRCWNSCPPETRIAVGNSAEAFRNAAPNADVIYNWSLTGKLLREVFLMCPRVQWVHSRAAGLDNVLFPELVESPVPLTNGSGVFSPSLGEFALAAILYFAKDFRRMVAQPGCGRVGTVRHHRNYRPDGGDCGVRRYRPGSGDQGARHGDERPGNETARRSDIPGGSAGEPGLYAGAAAGDARALRLRGGGGAADSRRRAA